MSAIELRRFIPVTIQDAEISKTRGEQILGIKVKI